MVEIKYGGTVANFGLLDDPNSHLWQEGNQATGGNP